MKIILGILLVQIFIIPFGYSQGHQWWANNVGWDGHSSWESYIILKPGHMGPNAFYIPNGMDGKIDTTSYLQLNANSYFTPGEVTLNPFIVWNINFGKKASLQINGAPIEYFNTSHELKTERKIFHLNYYDKFALGDVRVMFCGQIAKNMALYVGIKTASGTNIGSARFTDTPQYFFNYSISTGSSTNHFYATAGFTAWQTYDPTHNQNDGFTYGLAYIKRFSENWTVKPELYGIVAYLHNGDRPMIASIEFKKKLFHNELNFFIRQGIFDFPFTNVGMGYKWIWK